MAPSLSLSSGAVSHMAHRRFGGTAKLAKPKGLDTARLSPRVDIIRAGDERLAASIGMGERGSSAALDTQIG